jgi:hypothetical protein
MKTRFYLFQWVIIGILIVISALLIFKTLDYRKKFMDEEEKTEKSNWVFRALDFEKTLKRNFLFKDFPIDLKPENLAFFPADRKDAYYNGNLVMIFDFTVCGKCLNQSFEVLNEFRILAEEKNIAVLSLVGIGNINEEGEVINLYRSGQMPSPFKTLKVDLIYEKFLLDKNNYLDTPFFIYTSNDARVLDIFKPVYLDEKELRRWLEIIVK